MCDILFRILAIAFVWVFFLGIIALALSGCAPARLIADCINRTIGCS